MISSRFLDLICDCNSFGAVTVGGTFRTDCVGASDVGAVLVAVVAGGANTFAVVPVWAWVEGAIGAKILGTGGATDVVEAVVVDAAVVAVAVPAAGAGNPMGADVAVGAVPAVVLAGTGNGLGAAPGCVVAGGTPNGFADAVLVVGAGAAVGASEAAGTGNGLGVAPG